MIQRNNLWKLLDTQERVSMFSKVFGDYMSIIHLVGRFMFLVEDCVMSEMVLSERGLHEDEKSRALLLKYQDRMKRKSWKVSIIIENGFHEF